jgi:hypothetical protein|tara:strand:- start:327 stop:938 length:612 start_codon:yes stop_codon:yes gene_type:complete
MALSSNKRAKQIERKKKKRKEVLKGKIQENNMYLTISDPSLIPVDSCYITENWQESGMSAVYITRKRTEALFIVTHIILDTFCLGVKKCQNYKLNLMQKNEFIEQAAPLALVEPEYIKMLVNEAIRFASQFKFSPPSSYTSIKKYVDNLPDTKDTYNFQFGDKEGNPLYIQGPYDDDEFTFEVIEKLEHSKAQYNTVTLMREF